MDSLGLDSSLVILARELEAPLVLLRQLGFELERSTDITRNEEIVRQMRVVSERSLRLVRNLTKIAHLDGALFALEPIQLNNLCREITEEISPLSRLLEKKIVFEFSQKNTVVVANRDLLQSFLMGLIDDAIQYSPKDKEVKITTKIHKNRAIISVREFDESVDLRDFRRLKKTIGKQDAPISAKPHSSGLIFLVMERFSRAMQGDFKIQRHHSGGTTFSLTLPLSSQLSLWRVA